MTIKDVRTWIEINSVAVKHNIAQIRSILSPRTALWAVVKSNAYGHGISTIQQLFDKYGIDNFEFRVVEYCERDNCLLLEQQYLDKIFSFNENFSNFGE